MNLHFFYFYYLWIFFFLLYFSLFQFSETELNNITCNFIKSHLVNVIHFHKVKCLHSWICWFDHFWKLSCNLLFGKRFSLFILLTLKYTMQIYFQNITVCIFFYAQVLYKNHIASSTVDDKYKYMRNLPIFQILWKPLLD